MGESAEGGEPVNSERTKKNTRPAGSAAERARGDSHQAGGNPCWKFNMERGGGQVGIGQEVIAWHKRECSL